MTPSLTGLPTLHTSRLVLRGPLATDWPPYRAFALSDRTAFVGGPQPEDKVAQKFSSFFGHWVLRGFGRLIAQDRASGQPIGHFGPMQWTDDAAVELTWSLWSAGAEGKGLATEAALALRDWCFGALGLASAYAEVHRDNAASHSVARRLGGQVLADRRPTWFDDGSVYLFTAGGNA